MSDVHARFERCIDKRTGGHDRLVVVTDRHLKTDKLDYFELTAAQARTLAMELLVAADRSEGNWRGAP